MWRPRARRRSARAARALCRRSAAGPRAPKTGSGPSSSNDSTAAGSSAAPTRVSSAPIATSVSPVVFPICDTGVKRGLEPQHRSGHIGPTNQRGTDMRYRLIGVGATVAAIAAAVAFVAAQDNSPQRQAGPPRTVQGLAAGRPGTGGTRARTDARSRATAGTAHPAGEWRAARTRSWWHWTSWRARPHGGPESDDRPICSARAATRQRRSKTNWSSFRSRCTASCSPTNVTREKSTSLSARVAALQKQLADVHVKTATSVSDMLTEKQRETMRLGEGRGGGRGMVR